MNLRREIWGTWLQRTKKWEVIGHSPQTYRVKTYIVHQPNWCTGCTNDFWAVEYGTEGWSRLEDGLVKHMQKRPHTIGKSTLASLFSLLPLNQCYLFISPNKNMFIYIEPYVWIWIFWLPFLFWGDVQNKINVDHIFWNWFFQNLTVTFISFVLKLRFILFKFCSSASPSTRRLQIHMFKLSSKPSLYIFLNLFQKHIQHWSSFKYLVKTKLSVKTDLKSDIWF